MFELILIVHYIWLLRFEIDVDRIDFLEKKKQSCLFELDRELISLTHSIERISRWCSMINIRILLIRCYTISTGDTFTTYHSMMLTGCRFNSSIIEGTIRSIEILFAKKINTQLSMSYLYHGFIDSCYPGIRLHISSPWD